MHSVVRGLLGCVDSENLVRRGLCLVGCATVLWFVCSTGVAGASGWSIEPTPNPAGASLSGLLGVSCTRASSCTAVGFSQLSSGPFVTLAERWNGISWEIQPTPNPAGSPASALHGVSCTDASDCMAVGNQETSGLNDLTLAEHWDGSSWEIESTPTPAGPPSQGVLLDSVSCPKPGACTAVGYATTTAGELTLAEDWDGSRWTIEPTPNPAGTTFDGFGGVSCTGPSACTAVGNYVASTGEHTLAERWNGNGWEIQPTPNPAGALVSGLTGVSCPSQRTCTATGFYETSTGTYQTLAERWNGSLWEIQPTPNPAGTPNASLSGVSCPKRRACTAVGNYETTPNTFATLAERSDRKRWQIQPTPNPSAPATGGLNGVSCPDLRACVAVGSYFTSLALTTQQTLAESYSSEP